jgi:bifunctional DNase/RNase
MPRASHDRRRDPQPSPFGGVPRASRGGRELQHPQSGGGQGPAGAGPDSEGGLPPGGAQAGRPTPESAGHEELIELLLVRLVHFEGGDRQHIFLREREAPGRSFPIVIGNFEAGEIQRIVAGQDPERPLTHRLLHQAIQAVGARLEAVDIVDLAQGTFYARLSLRPPGGGPPAQVDARPSDAIALALRARCPIRVARHVLEQAALGGV